MSFMLIPHSDSPGTFVRIAGAQEHHALLEIGAFSRSVNDSAGEEGFDRFQLCPLTRVKDLEQLEVAEEKVALNLAPSRVPGAEGSRCVYVNLAEGTILLGRTVMLTAQRVKAGVKDETVPHQINLIQPLLELIAIAGWELEEGDLLEAEDHMDERREEANSVLW